MRFVLLLVAAVIAVIVGVAVLQYSNKGAPVTAQVATSRTVEQPAVTTVDVMVAKQPIEIGTVIDRSMVDVQPWPENLVVDGFILNNDKSGGVIGKVARGTFQPREPFIASKLANPNDPSFFAAHLPAGMRAVTMASDAVAGVAGYVFPGDRVDIVFTHNLPKEIYQAQQAATAGPAAPANRNAGSEKPGVSEVLVPNVRVLAINVRQATGKDQTPATTSPSSATVEIGEGDVQKLRLAEKNGTLSLALRSLKDQKNMEIPSPTMVETISAVQVQQPKGGESIKIVRGVGKDVDPASAQGVPVWSQPTGAGSSAPDIRKQ